MPSASTRCRDAGCNSMGERKERRRARDVHHASALRTPLCERWCQRLRSAGKPAPGCRPCCLQFSLLAVCAEYHFYRPGRARLSLVLPRRGALESPLESSRPRTARGPCPSLSRSRHPKEHRADVGERAIDEARAALARAEYTTPWELAYRFADDEFADDGGIVPHWVFTEGDARIQRRSPVLPLSRGRGPGGCAPEVAGGVPYGLRQPRQDDLLSLYCARSPMIAGKVLRRP